jgi:hypothetical protein
VTRYRYQTIRRLEADPRLADLDRGIAAEVADPLWLLGRQWQLGEHHGEDAASPVSVRFTQHETPIEVATATPDGDTTRTPPQAVVEAEPDQWWTPGRRVRLGRRVTADPAVRDALGDDPSLLLDGLPAPYHRLNGLGFDGRELWRRRGTSDLDLADERFEPRPPEAAPEDRWDTSRFRYHADLHAGDSRLTLRDHPGGDLDWYAVDANQPVGLTGGVEHTTLASQLRYPGAPTDRFWEIEAAELDLGGPAPDRSRFATLLLLELLSSHSDDWFTFAVDTDPGTVVTLTDVTVTDAFGDVHDLETPDDWSLFRVRGLDPRSLIVWPTVATPLTGPVRDEIVIGADEDAAMLWAVERRVEGRDVATDGLEPAEPEDLDTRAPERMRYHPGAPIRAHWHPYPLDVRSSGRSFVQGRLADTSGDEAVLAPPPRSDLLRDPTWERDPDADPHEQAPPHRIAPSAVPRFGLRLRRRSLLGRRMDGTPVLWSQRSRTMHTTPPSLPLPFDRLQPDPGRPAGDGDD